MGLHELNRILERARTKGWSMLALLGPSPFARRRTLIVQGWPADCVFELSEPLERVPEELLALGARLRSLALSDNNIGPKGARALSGLTALTTLDLMRNGIGPEGAKALSGLTSLTTLDLGGNNIGPEGARALSGLTSLTTLDLVDNNIGPEGAKALSGLTALITLNLTVNNIGPEGAKALSGLTALTTLGLAGNRIGPEGAKALSGLTALTDLRMMNCKIGNSGVQGLGELRALVYLDLDGNGIESSGAEVLGSLTSLQSLDLQNNRIERIPNSFRALSALEVLALKNNPLTDVPQELLANTTDAQAILAAAFRLRDAEKARAAEPLNEAKLLVIGNEAVGKTSLIQYLIHGKPCNPNQAKTAGIAIEEKIEISPWHPTAERQGPGAGGIRLNVWDFGGQEIMHETHKFFLSHRSLYLLVLEARRENDEESVHRWIKTIRNRGGDSPIIVVINKAEPPRDVSLDETQLRRRYLREDGSPQIVAFVRTSCASGRGIAELRGLVADLVTRHLPHVRDVIPSAYRNVKDDLSALARKESIVDVSSFHEMCDRSGITAAAERRALLRLLNDLGVVVAHHEDPEVTDAVQAVTLLDPNWITRAVYDLLNHPSILKAGGEFVTGDLGRLLDAKGYAPARYPFIVGMMEAFGLCFEYPGPPRGRYLIPEALSGSEPDFEAVWPRDSLRFRYDYVHMPPGLIPRFIVHANHLLTKNKTRWRGGALLHSEGCNVLVRSDKERRQVHIYVKVGEGDTARQRSALSVIRDHLEFVHRLNPECEPTPKVPWPGQWDIAVPFDWLVEQEKKHGPDHPIEYPGVRDALPVRVLLEGVRDDRREWAAAGKEDLKMKKPDKVVPADPPPAPPPEPVEPAERASQAELRRWIWLVPIAAGAAATAISRLGNPFLTIFGVIGIVFCVLLFVVIWKAAQEVQQGRGTFWTWLSRGAVLFVLAYVGALAVVAFPTIRRGIDQTLNAQIPGGSPRKGAGSGG